MSNTFNESLSFGQVAESTIAKIMMSRGWMVMPVYQSDTAFKGPQVFGLDKSLVAPDMFVFNGQEGKFIECKRKNSFTWHRKTAKWTTGIDSKHYYDYVKIMRSSPFKVYLVFIQEDGVSHYNPEGMVSPTGLYWQDLEVLANRVHHFFEGAFDQMVYWDEKDLIKVMSLDDIRSFG